MYGEPAQLLVAYELVDKEYDAHLHVSKLTHSLELLVHSSMLCLVSIPGNVLEDDLVELKKKGKTLHCMLLCLPFPPLHRIPKVAYDIDVVSFNDDA